MRRAARAIRLRATRIRHFIRKKTGRSIGRRELTAGADLSPKADLARRK
jgi:hypothetical protein